MSRKGLWLLATLLAASFAAWPRPCQEIAERAQTGDLVFRAEDSWISRAVMHAQGDARFSHVGIAVRTSGGVRVFHAEYDPASGADGVLAEDVCIYARRAVRMELRRLDAVGEPQRRAIAEAVRELGYPKYNLRLQHSPVDGTVYCTQYVWRVLERALPGRYPNPAGAGVITVTQVLRLASTRPP